MQPSTTSEHSLEERWRFQGGGLKRPMTGSESNASLSSPAGVEGAKNSAENDSLGHDEESSNVAPGSQASEDQDVPVQSSHFQLLDLLRIRLDMAANNMEINRLLANVDRVLNRTARIRKLGFRRIMAACKSRQVHPVIDVKENTRSNEEEAYGDEDETGTDEEESVIERGEVWFRTDMKLMEIIKVTNSKEVRSLPLPKNLLAMIYIIGYIYMTDNHNLIASSNHNFFLRIAI